MARPPTKKSRGELNHGVDVSDSFQHLYGDSHKVFSEDLDVPENTTKARLEFLEKIQDFSNQPEPLSFNLSCISKWCYPLRFFQLMQPLTDSDSSWKMQVVCLGPNSNFKKKANNPREGDPPDNLTAVLKHYGKNNAREVFKFRGIQFFKSCFVIKQGSPDEHRLQTHLDTKNTIMLLASNSKTSESNLLLDASSFVIASVIYSTVDTPAGKEDLSSSFIYLLATAPKDPEKKNVRPRAPSVLYNSWRGVGFGKLMVLLILKFTTINKVPPPFFKEDNDFQFEHPVNTYLQVSSQEPIAQSFYLSLGYHILTPIIGQSGLDLLPEQLKRLLVQKKGWIQDKDDMVLFLLRHGNFIIKSKLQEESKKKEKQSRRKDSGTFSYSFFPENVSRDGVLFSSENLSVVSIHIPILNSLLPQEVDHQLSPPNSNILRGYMYGNRRLKHTHKTWLNDGEIELVVAYLMRDTRYRDSVHVFPPRQTKLFGEYYKKVVALNGLNDTTPKRREASVKGRERQALKDCHRIVIETPAIFSRRLLIFIHNEGSCHWTATFVFNPGILVNGNLMLDGNDPQPCYLYYDPSGDVHCEASPPRSLGVFHYLNVAQSYWNWKNEGCSSTMFKYIHPFGKQLEPTQKTWFSTSKFPQLCLKSTQLPHQEDNHSCGLAVIATCALFMNGLYQSEKESSTVHQVFCRKNMDKSEVSGEYFCHLPPGFLAAAYTGRTRPNYPLFLPRLREEMLRLVDHLAKVAHGDTPNPDERYTSIIVTCLKKYPYNVIGTHPDVGQAETKKLDEGNGELQGFDCLEEEEIICLESEPEDVPTAASLPPDYYDKIEKQSLDKGTAVSMTPIDVDTVDADKKLHATGEVIEILPIIPIEEEGEDTLCIQEWQEDYDEGEKVDDPETANHGDQVVHNEGGDTTFPRICDDGAIPPLPDAPTEEAAKAVGDVMMDKGEETGDEGEEEGDKQLPETVALDDTPTSLIPDTPPEPTEQKTPDVLMEEAEETGDEGEEEGDKQLPETVGDTSSPLIPDRPPPIILQPGKELEMENTQEEMEDHQSSSFSNEEGYKEEGYEEEGYEEEGYEESSPEDDSDDSYKEEEENFVKMDVGQISLEEEQAARSMINIAYQGWNADATAALLKGQAKTGIGKPPVTPSPKRKRKRGSKKKKKKAKVQESDDISVCSRDEENYTTWKEMFTSYEPTAADKKPYLYTRKKEQAYVDRHFKMWGLLSDNEFRQHVTRQHQNVRACATKKGRKKILHDLAVLKWERRENRKFLISELKATAQGSVQALDYTPGNGGTYWATVKYKSNIATGNSDVVLRKSEERIEKLEVTRAWVVENFGKKVVDFLLYKHNRFDSTGSYLLKKNEMVELNVMGKITRIKYMAKHTREVINHQSESEARLLRECEPQFSTTFKKNEPVVKRMMTVTIPARFVAYNSEDFKGTPISEAEVIQLFGDEFVRNLKESSGRTLNIPVGDYHSSTLDQYPNLCLEGAPKVRFVHDKDEDRCIFKSACSALDYLGWKREAQEILLKGLTLPSGSSYALDALFHEVRLHLPKWIQMKKITKHQNFRWDKDLPPYSIFTGVLVSSDCNSNHAITINRKWIFDSNEARAIPLGKSGLDYCTCDGSILSKFVRFDRGILMYYPGEKRGKLERMTGAINN